MSQYECMDDNAIEQELDRMGDIIEEDVLESKAVMFKVLGDLNRIKIVELLGHFNQLCVYEISQFIDASVATTSHHLITLKNSGVINSQKHGKRVVYSLHNPKIGTLLELASDIFQEDCDAISL